MFDDVLKHRSGRVIASARAVLAATFLFALWIDPSEPAKLAPATYATLTAYLALALVVAAATWNSWWLDARLATPTHVVDITAFTLLVVVTDGYTSPFFVFFVFLVLTAAIRWGWRETALTAVAVTLLYFAAGFAGGSSGANFDLQRFIIRSGNLLILSVLLIWFGVNQGFSGLKFPRDDLFGDPSPDGSPLEATVRKAMTLARARSALLLWRAADAHEAVAVAFSASRVSSSALPRSAASASPRQALLFDLPRDRALGRSPQRRFRFLDAHSVLRADILRRFDIAEGLAVPIRSEAGVGVLLLGTMEGLCTDHIEFGDQLGRAIASHIQRQALLSAVQESARSRARLSLARDLHDSIVQFLAGATFRIEAIARSLKTGERPERELKDLKQLMLQEQQELRSAIGALRSERIALPTLAADVKVLCERLGRQWDIDCSFSAEVPDVTAPMRLHLDTHQLIREAVANAVRHARAKFVRVQMTAEDSELRLDISNDGGSSERLKKGSPWSLRERVDEANGTLMLASRATGTDLSITLPLSSEVHP